MPEKRDAQTTQRRDDFAPDTKRRLAARAGNRCSFPGCNAATSGPSAEAPNATSQSGMACHIAAASGGPGARRVVSSMTPEERMSIENGIWLCYTHGKLIDTDETTFSLEMLRRWRDLAVLKAAMRQQYHGTLPAGAMRGEDLAYEKVEIHSQVNANSAIGNALALCCVHEIWGGDVTGAIRDFMVEVTRNALEHGGASRVTFEIAARTIRLRDNGKPFEPIMLADLQNVSGGALSARALMRFKERLIVHGRSDALGNELTIAFARSARDIIEAASPCVVECSRARTRERLQPIANCNEIYLVLPAFVTYSDIIRLANALALITSSGCSLVFAISQTSDDVQAFIEQEFPSARIISLDE